MQLNLKDTPPWLLEFHKQLLRGRAVILYGNIQDMFLLDGVNRSLRECLELYFRTHHYRIIVRYDIADGVQLLDEKLRSEFERLSAPVTSYQPPAHSGSYDMAGRGAANSTAREPVTTPGTGQVAQAGLTLRKEQDAFPRFRRLLAQPQVPSAVMLFHGDRFASDPQRFDANERPLMVQLEKMAQERAFITDGDMQGLRHALVLITGALGTLPSWLYRDNPHLAAVQVPKPAKEERRRQLRPLLAHFEGGTGIDAATQTTALQQLVDLTDGMAALDLEALRRTSIIESIPVTQARTLVDFFKYGQRENPWEKLDAGRIREATDSLGRSVIGQKAAVDSIGEMLVSARVGITLGDTAGGKAGRPRGVFFFVGPTGVGKTELAKAVTELVFSDPNAFARFDMSEYKESHSAERLTGSPPGYVGYEEGGQLTNRMLEHPFSVLLFDEVEKGNPLVLDKFLQILDDGRLTDSKGQTAYFSQSLIIFTSNCGSQQLDELIQRHGGHVTDELPSYKEVKQLYLRAVEDQFVKTMQRPELFNRLGDSILVFDMLRPLHVAGIVDKFQKQIVRAAREKLGFSILFPDSSVVAMVQQRMNVADNAKYGGRRVRTIVEAEVQRPLNRWVFENEPAQGSTLEVRVSVEGRLQINKT